MTGDAATVEDGVILDHDDDVMPSDRTTRRSKRTINLDINQAIRNSRERTLLLKKTRVQADARVEKCDAPSITELKKRFASAAIGSRLKQIAKELDQISESLSF